MRSILVIVLCFAVCLASAQQKTPFTKIKFAGSELKAGKLEVYFYGEIDPSGIFRVRLNYTHEPQTIELKLPDSTRQLLASVFNGSDLGQYLVPKEMKNGEHFSNSSYRFIQVQFPGKTQELFFVRYLLNDLFRSLIIQLEEHLHTEESLPKTNPLQPSKSFLTAMEMHWQQNRDIFHE